jgi:mono/diheme cytochrome c family protein
MKDSLRPFYFIAAALLVIAGAAFGQNPTVKIVPVQPTATLNGADLYHEYCAVCHGADAKGNGPAAAALKERPSDLTLITRRNNGKFPALNTRMVILGQSGIAAHGSAEMPIWGDLFRSISSSNVFVEVRVQSLLAYLEQIQR